MSAAAADRRSAASLFFGLTLLYALATGGHVYSPDALTMARTTESLVDRGELAILDPGYPPGFLTAGRDGRRYSKYGLGMPLAGVPGLLAGRAAGAIVGPEATASLFVGPRFLWYDPADPADAWSLFGISLTAAPLVATSVTLLFLLARAVGFERRQGLVVASVAALASPLPVYAKTFFSEPLALLAVTGLAWALARWSRAEGGDAEAIRPSPAWWVAVAGTFLGLAATAKVAHLVLLPVTLAGMAWHGWRRGLPGHRLGARLTTFVGGFAPWALALAAANSARFGSPLESGYGAEAARFTTPFLEGLRGLLVSPGRGLVVYFPLALVSVLAAPRLARRAPLLVFWTGGAVLAFLALYSPWHGWDGGWTWGPRFFVPLVPLFVLLAAPWLLGEAGGWRRWIAWVAAALSAVLGWIGTLVPFTEYHHALRQTVGGGYLPVARWSWEVWPPLAYWHFPWDYWLLPRIFQVPAAWPLAAASGVAIALLPFLAWKAWCPYSGARWAWLAAGGAVAGGVVAGSITALGAGG